MTYWEENLTMKKVLFLMLAVALMAMPAMASVQNVKVSGDIESSYVIRDQFDFQGFSQDVLLTQTRLRVDADLTDKVAATIGLINERVWGADANNAEVDLNLAYVTMKEMLYSPLTVTLGRQNFAFGNSFVIDSAGANNAAVADSGLNSVAEDLSKEAAQDAVRMTFDYDPLTIDVLYSAISQGVVTGQKKSDDADLVGLNAKYQFDDEKNTLVEGYVWARDNKDKLYMPGLRGSMNVLDGWNLQAEGAMQFGDVTLTNGKTDRRAYAAQFLSNYMLPFESTKKYQPVFGLAYTIYSGDKDVALGGDGEYYTAWDPMYENQNGGKIFNTLFNATNAQTIGATLTMVPVEDVTANLYYDRIWLDKELSSFSLVQPDGTSATPAQEGEEVELGDEVGLVLTYDYTEDVQLGARAGWFFPGNHYGNANINETASQLILNAKVAF